MACWRPPGGLTTDDFITNSLIGVMMKLIGAPLKTHITSQQLFKHNGSEQMNLNHCSCSA